MSRATVPGFFECGGCDHLHPFGWVGDCRDDARRYSLDRLDETYGETGWVEVDELTGLPLGVVYGADMGDADSTDKAEERSVSAGRRVNMSQKACGMTVAELIRVLKTLDPTFRVDLYVTHEGKEYQSRLVSVATDHKKSISLNDSKFEYSLDIPPGGD